ncbi:hypothetical protein Q5530_17495 [Saccharothrix sp. BKS2]|uniref:hypothetical protein n=1 Tax=Saccharothrix sp. BKS2 TaxID=3064400 RepID=UPI0039E99958
MTGPRAEPVRFLARFPAPRCGAARPTGGCSRTGRRGAGTATAGSAHAATTVTDLGRPVGARSANATGINRAGVVSGSASYEDSGTRAVRFNVEGTTTDLGLITGYSDSFALAVDDNGVVGGVSGDTRGPSRVVRWVVG